MQAGLRARVEGKTVFSDQGLPGELVEELVEALNAHPSGLIFYLSCNPTTLARDLRKFLSSYELMEITGFDFFPRTPHIETLAGLRARPLAH